jgi:hypothetical protein
VRKYDGALGAGDWLGAGAAEWSGDADRLAEDLAGWAALGFYGADCKKMTLPQLVRVVRASLHDHGTKVLILDDITRLKMHREADQDALDLPRSLMSMHTTLVLIGVGIPGSGLLREGRRDPRTGQWALPPARPARSCNDEAATQTERRFDLINLGPFRYDTPAGIAAWVTHLTGIEQHLRLFRAAPGMLTGNTMPEYLFRRTNGIVGLLERLVEDGCALAISDGTERLTTGVLDQVDINLGNVPGRDPCAGEIPQAPARPTAAAGAQASPRGKRPRNTVFDDHGQPGAAAE